MSALSTLVQAMLVAGVLVLVAGVLLARGRVMAAAGADKVVVLGPVFAASALAVFAMEHFFDAKDLMGIVPKWLPGHLFWTYLVGVALLAAALSFIAWRCVRWSALLLALLFLIIVATVDLPNLGKMLHNRIFWVLTVRECAFAGGAMVLAGSQWARGALADALMRVGRWVVAAIMVFYAVEHFLYPHNVPGVPLEKMTPAWMPAPVMIAYVVGIVLLIGGVGLMMRGTARFAAAGAGFALLMLVALFYVPIMVKELHTPLAVEGINYVYDTLLFAATVLMAGLGGKEAYGRG